MALEPQKAVVQFRGLETKVDEKQLIPGDLTLLENVIYDTVQEFRKRNGYALVAQADAGLLLTSFKKERLLADGHRLQAVTTNGLVDKGLYEPLSVTTQSIAKSNYTQQMPDAARSVNGVSVFAWESVENGVTVSRYSIFDDTTKQPVVSNVLLGSRATRPRVVILGDLIYVFYVEGASSVLAYVRLSSASPSATPVEGTVASGVSGIFDVCVGKDSTVPTPLDQLYVVYATLVGNISGMRIMLGGEHTAALVLVTATPDALTVFEKPGQDGVWIGYGAGGASGVVYAKNFNQSFTGASSTFNISGVVVGEVKNITGISDSAVHGGGFFFYECWDALNGRSTRWALSGPVSGVIQYGLLTRLVGLASKVFLVHGSFRLVFATGSALQSSYFVVRVPIDVLSPIAAVGSPVVVARLASGVGGGFTKKAGLPGVTVDGDEASFPYLQTDRLVSTAGGLRTQTGVQAATLTWNALRESLELGDTLLLTGGILSAYDGVSVGSHGFHLYPEDVIASGQPNGLVAGDPTQTGAEAGSYQVCVTYEKMDNAGLLHQSAPSPAVTVEATAGQMFSYQIPTYTVGDETVPVSIVIYRTLVNSTVFFRVTSVESPLLNDPTEPWVRYTEATPDTLLSANAQLVSNPLNSMAEVPALAVDAPRFITRYRNRAVTIPAEAPGQWQFSKTVLPGVPVEFNPQQFYNPVQGGGVPLTCAIEMDDKLILFGEDRIYWTAGDGPAPNGTGSDYGNAFRVPSDVGCANPRSLVLAPAGVFFQSAKGLYLLGRDLSVQYIGAPVERFNGFTVTSATLVPNSRRIVFTMAPASGQRIALAYDYFVQKWAVWTQYDAADALSFGGKLCHLREDGKLYEETPGVFSDAGSRYFIKLRTSWLSFAGLSGYQRVWRFIVRGSYRGAHKLLISVAFDDNPAAEQNVEVDATQVFTNTPVAGVDMAGVDSPGGGEFTNYEWQVKLLRQKTTSVQVTITEAPLDTPNEGLSISVLTFLVGILPKLKKLAKGHNLTPGTPSAAPAGGGGGVG